MCAAVLAKMSLKEHCCSGYEKLNTFTPPVQQVGLLSNIKSQRRDTNFPYQSAYFEFNYEMHFARVISLTETSSF